MLRAYTRVRGTKITMKWWSYENLIEVYFIYEVVFSLFCTAKQLVYTHTHTHTHIFHILFHYSLPQDIGYSSQYYSDPWSYEMLSFPVFIAITLKIIEL